MDLSSRRVNKEIWPGCLFSKSGEKILEAKIQNVRLEMWFCLYNLKCIDFKPHKCIKCEYKVGRCEQFDTKYMSVPITVLEIQVYRYYKYAKKKNLSNTYMLYMLYLKDRNRYRHVFGIRLFTMSNFVFTFNIFMRLKINAF